VTIRVLVPRRISAQRPDAAARIGQVSGRSMGCDWSVRHVSDGAIAPNELTREIGQVLERVVQQMSTWEVGSAITRFNRAAAGTWHALPEEFAQVLACALRVAEASDGALDPTAGGLISLWGFGATGRHNEPGFGLPTDAAIESALRHCGWQRLHVDADTMRMYQPGGLQLDLSAVAKGFGVDEVSRRLSALGIEHHLVDIGGELRGAGMKPDGAPWWVEIQRPPDSIDAPLTRIALHGLSVATSGDYLQYFQQDNRRFNHCIDPRSGRPVDNGVASVTVLHEECMEADAWATALMVLGPRDGVPLADGLHVAAQFLVRTVSGVEEQVTRAFRELIA
jgi:thiamine biosynthesis lipoprotein